MCVHVCVCDRGYVYKCALERVDEGGACDGEKETLKQIFQSGSCQKSFFAIIITFEKMILARPRPCLQKRMCSACG